MEQLELFERESVKIDKPIRLIELFAGYGSQAMAMRNIGADFESYFVCEFDEFAVKSYNAVHGTDFRKTDIRDIHGSDLKIVDKDKYCYLMFYSFPCTDLSLAGKQQGMSKGSGTRSGLLWEVERILYELKESDSLPDILCCENVPQIIAEKNKPDFLLWIKSLYSLGYSSIYKTLNAKDFGIPQNRVRFFMFSFLGDYDYQFPTPIPLQYVIKDVLEDEVDEKYYIKSEKAKRLIADLYNKGVLEGKEKVTCDLTINKPKEIEVMNCIKARYDAGITSFQSEGGGVVERL